MPTECSALLRGKVARITRVDGCGNPVMCDAPNDTTPQHVVSDGVISMQIEPEIDAGTDITQDNWNGDSCVDVPACPKIRWINITATFCRMDPELFSMWTGVPVVHDSAGNATGFRVRKSVSCEEGVALEIWTGSVAENRCTTGGGKAKFGYIAIPWVVNGVLGSYTIENGAVTFQVTAKGIDGGGWGVGPYDIYEGTGAAAKLQTPFGPGDLEHIDTTTLEPPTPFCGFSCTVTPVPPTATVVVGDTPHTAILTYDNGTAGSVDIDWGDGSAVVTTPTGTGTANHVYDSALTGDQTITVSDSNNSAAVKTVTFAIVP